MNISEGTVITNLERYQILTQPYIGRSDIMKVTGFCSNKTSELITEIIIRATKQGKKLLYERGRVPSKYLIERLDLDMEEIYQNAVREKSLGL
jgi:hypothetical protein